MTGSRITPIVMPKWGLSMREGKLTGWLVEDGKTINAGEAILEVETDKIAGSVEAADAGVLRRRVGAPDTVYPVKALLGVIADPSVPDSEIDAYVSAYVTPAPEEGEESAAPAYEFVDLGNGNLRYAKRGAGDETILLIHGFGGDLDNWLFNIDALAENAAVYALDLPGHGQSAKKVATPTVAGLARTVLAFMDRLNIDKAHLVGHSLGGAIAMQIGQNAPSRVKSLTLIGSAGFGPDINMDYIRGFIGSSSRKELKPVLEKLFADPSQVSRQMTDDILKYKRLDGVSQALQSLADAAFAGGKQQAILGPGSIRTLAIWGKDDHIVPAAHAANAAPARVEIIDGAGHMVQMEQASRVNALIKANVAGQ
jgi:pyruvate dehydrogenase E2 component (dihydrolipoamide acetyltransferase)